MSQPLIIWLPDEPAQPWPWFQGDRHGIAISGRDKKNLGEIQTTPVQIILSGQSIRQIQNELPPMKEADKVAAARFAIENKIGASITGQHIVIGGPNGQTISVISHEKIKDMLFHLSQADILADEIYADFEALPEGRTYLFSDRVIYPGSAGYTLDRDWADIDGPEDHLSQAMLSLDVSAATNLLTGAYAKTTELPLSKASLARIAALLLVTFTAWLGLEWAQTRALTQQVTALKTETSNLYTAATGAPAPANPALAVTRAVKNGSQSQGSFLELSRLLFTSVAQTDGIMIETLQYDRQKNQLSLRLIYPQFESAGALEDAVRTGGGVFRSGGVREQSGRLIGDAILEVAP